MILIKVIYKALFTLSLFLMLSSSAFALTSDEAYAVISNKQSSFDAKLEAFYTLSDSSEKYVPVLIDAAKNSNLYYSRKDSELYVLANGNYFNVKTSKVFSGKKRDLKRVAINNQIRESLALLSEMKTLEDKTLSEDARIESAHNLIGKVSISDASRLQFIRDTSISDFPELAENLDYVIASADLNSQEPKIRNGAMRILANLNSPILIQKFEDIAKNDSDISNRVYAEKIYKNLSSTQSFYSGVETLYFGISLGSVLVLAAIGLTITFGVMGVINMAHGELMMIGAYTVYVMQQALPNNPGLALLLSIPMAFLVSGLTGIIIERTVIRYLYGRPLETLLATFGISLLLQQGVRTIFTALNKNVVIPDFLSGAIKINDFFSITYSRFYIIIFCLAVFFALRHILKHSRLGLEVRAVSQNRAMARNMGVRSERVNALTFGLGSGIAGLAGVALSQLTNVGPNLGQNYIVDSFLVVVFGGSGNIWGTMVAGMTLGIANKVLEPVAGAMLGKILILIGVIIFIQRRPRGLFPQRGRNVED